MSFIINPFNAPNLDNKIIIMIIPWFIVAFIYASYLNDKSWGTKTMIFTIFSLLIWFIISVINHSIFESDTNSIKDDTKKKINDSSKQIFFLSLTISSGIIFLIEIIMIGKKYRNRRKIDYITLMPVSGKK